MELSIRTRLHDLLQKVKNARLLATVTGDSHERMDIAATTLDEVEKELEVIEAELDDR